MGIFSPRLVFAAGGLTPGSLRKPMAGSGFDSPTVLRPVVGILSTPPPDSLGGGGRRVVFAHRRPHLFGSRWTRFRGWRKHGLKGTNNSCLHFRQQAGEAKATSG